MGISYFRAIIVGTINSHFRGKVGISSSRGKSEVVLIVGMSPYSGNESLQWELVYSGNESL